MKHSILFSLLLTFWVFSGCSLLVEVKDPPGNPSCGDGQISGDEECDGSNLAEMTCGTLGKGTGTLACATDCRFDTSGCDLTSSCGNGSIEGSEQCDGDNLNGKTCLDLSFGGGFLACNTDCTFNTSECTDDSTCGNGAIDTGEDCDGTNLNDQSCVTQGFPAGQLLCKTNCRFDITNCYYSDEICNDGIDNDGDGFVDCDDVDCATQCPGYCGDGIIQDGDGEDCDLTNLNNTSCADWGFNNNGTLDCSSTCRMEFYSCNYPAISLPNPTSIAAGGAHTCMSNDGSIHCWGSNQFGQLGVNSPRLYLPVPVQVNYSGTSFGASSLAAGGMHTCAVTTMSSYVGKILCWGNNTTGQLGDGGSFGSPVPVFTNSGSSLYTQVTAGFEHTCALRNDGIVQCWGSNQFGQLGNNTTIGSSGDPVPVHQLTNVTRVVAGFNHTCAIKDIDGTVNELWCWGANESGQLGLADGVPSARIAPVQVTAFSKVLDVALGQAHTCAIDGSTQVYCWGSNNFGQLGVSGQPSTDNPTQLAGFTALSLQTGSDHTCAITTASGSLSCWGKNTSGQLGAGHINNVPSPTTIGFTNVSRFSGGSEHSCLIETINAANITAFCTGGNWYGQLGTAQITDLRNFSPVVGQ